jgi:hypothetical protein
MNTSFSLLPPLECVMRKRTGFTELLKLCIKSNLCRKNYHLFLETISGRTGLTLQDLNTGHLNKR